MDRKAAEALAIDALGWLAGEPEAMGAFLAQAGAGPAELRARAAEPEFLGFVLDHLLTDDAMVRAFCEATRRPFEAPMRARAALPGGDLPEWT